VRFVLFYHSALSDWNHGNAHFLRGVAVELQARGHDVIVYEPADAWSAVNLVEQHGRDALLRTADFYPTLQTSQYASPLALDNVLDQADVVIVHEWNAHELVRAVGEHRARSGRYVLLFHDTHHRSVSDTAAMAAYDLAHYDGVLAFGEVIRQRYLHAGWAADAWTWHEAADVRVFGPRPEIQRERDLVWIGNWGDDERTAELREFLIEPVRQLRLDATVHGVRYPPEAVDALAAAGITYGGWLPNYGVPAAFARHRVTVHVPRRPYVDALPGIPTIRPFEALACGIPLVSAPWDDAERLFRGGVDYLIARNGAEMQKHLRDVLEDEALALALATSGRETVLAKHTCAHRVDELMQIVEACAGRTSRPCSTADASGSFARSTQVTA
jgi:spore maturation protein CgeB